MSAYVSRRRISPRWSRSLTFAGFVLATLVLIWSPVSLAQAPAGPVVTVTGGQVQGRLLPAPGGAVFKGIPYAAPPVGNLRWREARPVVPWSGVRQAAEYGSRCSQVTNNKAVLDTMKEDCLFMNIWTPAWPASGRAPVMMFIHGGGLTAGSGQGGANLEFNGASLARHGVVVVTINYRINLFAMMGHPELTAESPHKSSGNYAVFDHIAALRWIRDNISRFGGDPGNVTLFGQSAGGRYISFLLTSPLTKGLIHKAILESGNATASHRENLTLRQMERMGEATAKILNAPSTGAVAYMRGLPPGDIIAAYRKLDPLLDTMGLPFEQGFDGYAVPELLPAAFRAHKEWPVPVILGSNTYGDGGGGGNQGTDWVKNRLRVFYGGYPDLYERALKVYGFNGTPNEVSDYQPAYGSLAAQLVSDIGHRCGSVVTAGWHSAIAPTWQYEFSHYLPKNPPTHSAELRFVWGGLSADQRQDASAPKLSETMQTYWTTFAKTGDPNGGGLPAWPKYTPAAKAYMEFGNAGTIQKADLRPMACALFSEKINRDLDGVGTTSVSLKFNDLVGNPANRIAVGGDEP